MNFTRKGYGRIYVANENDIPKVDSIIKQMDEFEHEYLPNGFIAPFSEYPKLCYTHKFDSLDINALTAICLKQGITIFCCDNGHNEYMKDCAEEFLETIANIPQQSNSDLCEGMPHGSCKGETMCDPTKSCFRPA